MSLSVDHVNRIHFAGKQIKKIIGDQSQYKVILSDNRKDVFIQLNVKKDEIINMSVIDVSGKIADLEIKAINRALPSFLGCSNQSIYGL
jgi:predicted metal-dependent peptidase